MEIRVKDLKVEIHLAMQNLLVVIFLKIITNKTYSLSLSPSFSPPILFD